MARHFASSSMGESCLSRCTRATLSWMVNSGHSAMQSKAAGESGMSRAAGHQPFWKTSPAAHRLTRAYSSTQTTFPLAWLQNWILPVHLSRRWTPIDDETTCHRRRKTLETIISSTATMTVIGERLTNHPSLRRVTGTWRYSLRTWLLSDHPRSRSRSFRRWR